MAHLHTEMVLEGWTLDGIVLRACANFFQSHRLQSYFSPFFEMPPQLCLGLTSSFTASVTTLGRKRHLSLSWVLARALVAASRTACPKPSSGDDKCSQVCDRVVFFLCGLRGWFAAAVKIAATILTQVRFPLGLSFMYSRSFDRGRVSITIGCSWSPLSVPYCATSTQPEQYANIALSML